MNENNSNITHIQPAKRLNRYTYSISFSTERELTKEEIMEVPKVLFNPVRDIILKETNIDIQRHNTSYGIEYEIK